MDIDSLSLPLYYDGRGTDHNLVPLPLLLGEKEGWEMFNLVLVEGAITEDPIFRKAGTGGYYEFVVLTDQEYKDASTGKWKKKYDPVRVVAWNKPWLTNAVRKGDVVRVEGRLQMRPMPMLENDKEQRWDSEVVARSINNISRYESPIKQDARPRMKVPLTGTIYDGLPEDEGDYNR